MRETVALKCHHLWFYVIISVTNEFDQLSWSDLWCSVSLILFFKWRIFQSDLIRFEGVGGGLGVKAVCKYRRQHHS